MGVVLLNRMHCLLLPQQFVYIIHETATYWSAFGQFVILLLIQIGGMGVITIAASFAMISGRKISLIGGLKWNCQDKIRISFFMRSVTMHPLKKRKTQNLFRLCRRCRKDLCDASGGSSG